MAGKTFFGCLENSKRSEKLFSGVWKTPNGRKNFFQVFGKLQTVGKTFFRCSENSKRLEKLFSGVRKTPNGWKNFFQVFGKLQTAGKTFLIKLNNMNHYFNHPQADNQTKRESMSIRMTATRSDVYPYAIFA